VDYLVISWIFFHLDISLPFVASGDNLAMPLVGSLLRSSGAFYIRRQFGEDAIYRAVVTEYMTQLLEYSITSSFALLIVVVVVIKIGTNSQERSEYGVFYRRRAVQIGQAYVA